MLREHRVTEQQWRVIRALHDHSALSASEMSQQTLISMPSLSRIIRTLEERRLITRSARQNDQRSIELKLTDKGKLLLNEVGPESELIYQEIAIRFGAEKLNVLYELIDELTDRLESANQPKEKE